MAAVVLPMGPAWAQVYKCQGADGRVEYAAKPCAAGKGEALQIKEATRTAPAAKATAAATAAPVNGSQLDMQPNYMGRLTCESVAYRAQAIESELADLASGADPPRSRLLNDMLRATRVQQRDHGCDRLTGGWYTDREGQKAQDCRAPLAELRRHTVDRVRGDMKAQGRIDEQLRRLVDMRCAAPG